MRPATAAGIPLVAIELSLLVPPVAILANSPVGRPRLLECGRESVSLQID